MTSEPHYWAHPVDELEPLEDSGNEYREAAQRFAEVMDIALAAIARSDSPEIEAWAVGFALGLPFVDGKSMSEIADKFGVGRACISKRAVAIGDAMRVYSSPYRKSPEAREAYRQARLRQLTSDEGD